MTAKIYDKPSNIVDDGVKTGQPVKGRDWQYICDLSNYLNGAGGTIVPAHPWPCFRVGEGSNDFIKVGENKTFKYYIWQRLEANTRVWIFRFAAKELNEHDDDWLHFKGDVEINGDGIKHEVYATNNYETTLYVYDHVTPSVTPTEQTVLIRNTGTAAEGHSSLIIEQISCYEVPRYSLTGEPGEKMAQPDTCKKGKFIREQSAKSVFGPFEGVAQAKSVNRRNGIFHLYEPDGIRAQNATYTYIFTGSVVEPEVLGRYLTNGTVNDTLRWNVNAKVDAGTGYVRLSPSYTGATTYVMTITTTVASWHVSNGDAFLTRAEDLSASDGRRNSVWSTVKFEAKVSSEDTLVIYGISIGEHAGD
jgi:hypothetical protein